MSDRERLCGHNHLAFVMIGRFPHRKHSLIYCSEDDCDLEISGWPAPRFNKTRDKFEYALIYLKCIRKQYLFIPDSVKGSLEGLGALLVLFFMIFVSILVLVIASVIATSA